MSSHGGILTDDYCKNVVLSVSWFECSKSLGEKKKMVQVIPVLKGMYKLRAGGKQATFT